MNGFPPHSAAFRQRRFLNWFPLGIAYALLYMGRYNLTVSKNALGDLMTKEDFGYIFGVGAVVYAFSFLVNGPLVDRIGGKRGMLIGVAGAALMNLLMGLYLYHVLGLPDPASARLRDVYIGLYALNMYFQSYGAVSIVKVNANWFHLTERGIFSGIFGIMIAAGLFLAFDVSGTILGSRFVVGQGFGGGGALWWVFLAPAALLAAIFAVESFLLRDRPAQAGFSDFETGDASAGEDLEKKLSPLELYKRILTHPVILTIAAIEFCTGVLRNGVMHWFPIYATERSAVGVTAGFAFMLKHWGFLLMIAGIVGGNAAGIVSDRLFQSRRAPAAVFLYGALVLCTIGMIGTLASGWALGALVFLMSVAVIGTHGLLSGTATMDFGGRKGAATAVGVIDGFVYLGTGVQSLALGHITTRDWSLWPVFLLPFGVAGTLLLLRIWNARPGGARGH